MWKSISDKYEASEEGHIRNKKTKHVLREFKGRDGYLPLNSTVNLKPFIES